MRKLFVVKPKKPDVEKSTLGYGGQDVLHAPQREGYKHRKYMPGYELRLGPDQHHHWYAAIENPNPQVHDRDDYIKHHARPGDFIHAPLGNQRRNLTVLGRYGDKLAVLDPTISHVKLTSLRDLDHVEVHGHTPDLFNNEQDKDTLLQRKIIGPNLAVKDILRHPANSAQAMELHRQGLLHLPEGFFEQLATNPLTGEPSAPPIVGHAPRQSSGERYSPGETFKLRHYQHSLVPGDQIRGSRGSLWHVLGQDDHHIVAFTQRPQGAFIYAIRKDSNRTYTMMNHGNYDIDPNHLRGLIMHSIESRVQSTGIMAHEWLNGTRVLLPPGAHRGDNE